MDCGYAKLPIEKCRKLVKKFDPTNKESKFSKTCKIYFQEIVHTQNLSKRRSDKRKVTELTNGVFKI